MRANFVLSGVATGVRRNLTMTIALVLSTAIALAFVAAAILADKEIRNFKHDYESKLNVSLYLCPKPIPGGTDANDPCKARYTDAEKASLKAKLDADPLVTKATFISESEAVARFRKTQPTRVAENVSVGELPASFTVHLRDIGKDYAPFVAKYQHLPGVSGTTNESDVLKRLLNIIDGVRLASITIAVVVLVASILLIANTIQVAAAQRRNETSIMRLVGASRWMTELPFMLETVLASLVGGLISIALIWLGKHYVLDNIFKVQVQNGVIPNLNINDVLVAGGLGLLAGIAVSAITAFATLRLYVKL
jgi:cell division transport system permease protein